MTLLLFLSCDNESLDTTISNSSNDSIGKKVVTQDYWFPCINITSYFTPTEVEEILAYIKNDDLAAIGVYITPNPNYAPPSPEVLNMYLKVDNGWSILLGGSGEDDLRLLYNRGVSKINGHVKIDVPFNYMEDYTDSYIWFTRDGFYYYSGASEHDSIQVILGVDKTDTAIGFKKTYVSSCFNEGYMAPCITMPGELDFPFTASYIYPKRRR